MGDLALASKRTQGAAGGGVKSVGFRGSLILVSYFAVRAKPSLEV